ncbi:hypothetical protein ACHAAC_08765 [Aeromicrobium sp. CF4.19]|uniref:hypothetical protein n=1 Tax=Aeromicrobium sp. CF4.19 TaxID=3373082 RepID=UPI003EE620A7
MSEQQPPPTGRVRITSPRTSATSTTRRSVEQEIDESTGVGEVFMRSLIRSQLRAALTVLGTLMLTVGALPIAFRVLDDLTTLELLGIPLPWLVLGVFVYPGLMLLGWLYIRHAERVEADFAALVDPEHDHTGRVDSGHEDA